MPVVVELRVVELLALVELVVKLVVEETVNEVLVMLLACRARPKSTEGPHSSTAPNYHKQIWKFRGSSSIDSSLDAKNTYYHIKNISLSGQDGPRWAKTPNFQDLPAALIYGPCRSRRFKECNEVDSENLPRSMEIEIHYVQETFNAAFHLKHEASKHDQGNKSQASG